MTNQNGAPIPEKPQTRFTRAGQVAIAYQIVGDGPVDVVYASGWLHNIDVIWEHPGYARFLRGIASRCRLILFDKRGTGMSDRDVGAPTLEERAEDIRAVMDAAGSQRATLFGVSEGGNMTAVFAATYPERVRSIVMAGCFVCRARKPDWPHGIPRAEIERFVAHTEANWGDATDFLREVAASVADDPQEQAFMSRLLTQSASPSSMASITRLNYEIDIRSVLSAVKAPTLVLHGEKDNRVELAQARYLADALPNARFEIVSEAEHLPWIGPVDHFVDLITGFALSEETGSVPETVLTSILITDIAGSTEASVTQGDIAWLRTIEAHDAAAARAVARSDGRLVKSLGDGILATFSGPSRAVACAREMQKSAAALGLDIRAAIHTGECYRRGTDVSGLTVTIAARIADTTPAKEIWVSGTVRDLVVGSNLRFEEAGVHHLKGVPGDWTLHRLQQP